MSVTIFKLVDRAGEPYEENVLAWFLHRRMAERALAEMPLRRRRDKMLDGSLRHVIREQEINDDVE